MCGFTAIFSKEPIDFEQLKGIDRVLNHRGPDEKGQFVSDDNKAAFYFNRLSFQDLNSRSNQPFISRNGQYILVFNGEIYNFKELRNELITSGIIFQTTSDTEVLLAGFMHHGKDFFQRLEGMFAFVIFDQISKTIVAVRDRFGIKPLFYYQSVDLLVFSSEIKGIFKVSSIREKVKVRKASVATFLANRYIPTPFTMWENLFKVPPASFLTSTDGFKMVCKEYWNLKIENKKENLDVVKQNASDLIANSTRNHLVSDVEIGGFLSGGLDSTTLAKFASESLGYPFKTFSIGFKDWNESEDKYAKIVSDTLRLPFFPKISNKIDIKQVNLLMFHYDDPIADISILPTYEVSCLAASNVKAVLSGEGADEIMGGYWWDKKENFFYPQRYKRLLRNLLPKEFSSVKIHYIHAMSMGLFDREELSYALGNDYQSSIPEDPFQHFDAFELKGEPITKQIQYLNIKTFMSELVLQKIDRASMANSLEVRVPFLDSQLVSYFMSLSPESYMRDGIQKPILQSILSPQIPKVILERKKQGFVGPDRFYMEIEIYEKSLLNGYLIKDGVVKESYILQKIREKDYWRLWKLFVLECWWKVWVKSE
jgi:asparagine synthase (glutamine-hydrolysing)